MCNPFGSEKVGQHTEKQIKARQGRQQSESGSVQAEKLQKSFQNSNQTSEGRTEFQTDLSVLQIIPCIAEHPKVESHHNEQDGNGRNEENTTII